MHNSYAKSYIFRRRLHRGKKSSTETLHASPLTVRIYICTVRARTPCMICCLCNEGFLDGLPSNDDSKLATKTQPKYLPIFCSSFTKSTRLESEAIVCAFPITGEKKQPRRQILGCRGAVHCEHGNQDNRNDCFYIARNPYVLQGSSIYVKWLS